MTLKVRILQFSTTFVQVYVRPKIFLLGSSLAFNLKEGPVRCAKVCDKSWVILTVFISTTPHTVTVWLLLPSAAGSGCVSTLEKTKIDLKICP